jgi:hypothetical protein
LKEADGAAALAAFDRGEPLVLEVDGAEIALTRDDVLVETTQKPGLATQEDHGVTVALDTVLTDELIDEGYAREVISKLQTMRRDAGFDVTDRIQVWVQRPEPSCAMRSTSTCRWSLPWYWRRNCRLSKLLLMPTPRIGNITVKLPRWRCVRYNLKHHKRHRMQFRVRAVPLCMGTFTCSAFRAVRSGWDPSGRSMCSRRALLSGLFS